MFFKIKNEMFLSLKDTGWCSELTIYSTNICHMPTIFHACFKPWSYSSKLEKKSLSPWRSHSDQIWFPVRKCQVWQNQTVACKIIIPTKT